MSLTRAVVAEVLRQELCNAFSDLHGFTLSLTIDAERWRLKHGGGIAGRSGVWWIERVRDGLQLPNCKSATTKRDLRRLLREWGAFYSMGQKPAPRITSNGVRYFSYAKLHQIANGDQNFVWVWRRV